MDGIDTSIVDANTNIATNKDEIDNVQTNLDHEVEVLNLNMTMTETRLQNNIDSQAAAMNLADQALTNSIDATNTDLNNTKVDLAAEVAAGVGRDGRLQLIEDDTLTLFGNVDDINLRIDDTKDLMADEDTRLSNLIDSNVATLNANADQLRADMNTADQALTDEDTAIKADLASTNVDLAKEIQDGLARDATLVDHEHRITTNENGKLRKYRL